MSRNLIWLAGNYFCFFAILGLNVPYLSLFLDGRGFDSRQIGLLMAAVFTTRLLAPNLWAAIADHTGRRLELVRIGTSMALLCFLGLWLPGGAWWLTLVLALYNFFWNALLAQIEVLTLTELGERDHAYSRIRLWGSLGFILVSVGAGSLLEHLGSEQFVAIGTGLTLALWGCSLMLRPPPVRLRAAGAAHRDNGGRMLTPAFGLFLLSALLLQLSHGPYYAFFVLYMKQLGHSNTLAGALIALGVIAEIVIFMLAGRWLGRYGSKRVLMVALGLTVVRWLALGQLAGDLLLVALSQLLHAASFGLAHAASIRFLFRHVPAGHQSKGQALYASSGFGLGGVLGALVAGMTWQQGAGAPLSYSLAAISAALALGVVACIPREQLD